MASMGMTPLGNFPWICEGRLDMGGSLCTQRSIIDMINLLFLSVFYLLLLLHCSTRRRINNFGETTRKGWVYVAVSICCALTSVAHLTVGFWGTIESTEAGFHNLRCLISLVRGLIWISLGLSLVVKRPKSITLLVSVWWVSFFVLSTALNVEVLYKKHSIVMLEIMAWSVNLLLLVCAFRNYTCFDPENTLPNEPTIAEPLLVDDKSTKPRTQLCQAGFLGRLTFSWMNSLLGVGYSKSLALEDIPALASDDEANVVYQKFAKVWESLRMEKTLNNTRNMMVQAMAKVYWKEMVLVGFCALLRTFAVVVAPLFLYAFVNYSNRTNESLYDGLKLVGYLVVVKVVESLSQRHMFFGARRSGMRMRSALMVAIYQKQLKLSSLGRRRHSAGGIVNYIAVDAYRMGEFPWWLHVTWSCTLQLLLSISVLFRVVGLGAITGLVPLLICGLLNVPFAKIIQDCQSKFMVAQDDRLRATSEILNNMKIIKLQSWEEKFKNLAESLREKEFKWLARAQLRKTYGTLLYWMSPTIISSVVFVGCVLLHSAPLNAGTIFTILATLRTMGEPVRMIPEALSILIQVKVSFDRLSNFMLDDELEEEMRTIPLKNADESIKIEAGNFTWDPESSVPILRGLNLEVKQGEKVAICGSVGAGKSSLLYAILGEIPKVSGSVEVFGSTAYVSQVSWIQSGTIRDNILYGKEMEEIRYLEAIKACALDKDIDNFSHGDLTEIGQRGINVSGGQKQRIQLARAVYNDADIYLLDDPLSAVDAHTASVLFHDCVMAALKKKTVILVTHQVEFLPAVDKILVIEGGQVTQSGRYEELLKAGTAFEQLVNAHKSSITALDPSCNKSEIETLKVKKEWPQESNEAAEGEISAKGMPGVQLTEEEEKEIGDAGWKPFFDYILISKGKLLLSLSLIFQAGFVAFQAAATYWIALASTIPNISSATLIGVYTGISTLSAIFVYLRAFCGALLGLKASTAFFSAFTNAIFKAPMLFFDSTPVGRIFTRASSDLSVVDFDIPFAIIFVVSSGMELVAIIGIMVSVTWQVLIVAIIAMVASKYVQVYYLASATQLIRINGTTKAPIMNYAAETSQGVVTIRAFNMVDKFFQNYLRLVDIDAKLFFHSNAAMEWLVLRIEALQNLTLITAALLLVLLPKGIVAPELVGLSLSYALALTNSQVFLTRWYCNLSNYIISIERIKQFIHIPSEPPPIVKDKRPPSSWPCKGRIELQDLKVKYRPNAPLVLKGITCTFREQTRVGIVGRTGSGKTTLITALFRLVEPDSGRILIDGLDICSIGLKDLRMNLSIIPQEPTLFRGSIRTNLDPLGLYSDDEIWKAIEKCQLKETISSLPNLLDSSVSDEGENWSTGQRQLFCLGRVLLKRNRILVLDEATASIDSATDAALQRIIREEFSECTVMTVAHRVPTVIDSDMVMVLSYGNLEEYDPPSKLMHTNSSFSKLVSEYWASCRRNSTQNFAAY